MITDRDKILDDLYAESRYFDCHGCEFTEEDVDYVIELQEKKCYSYNDAISTCLNMIDDSLGY